MAKNNNTNNIVKHNLLNNKKNILRKYCGKCVDVTKKKENN